MAHEESSGERTLSAPSRTPEQQAALDRVLGDSTTVAEQSWTDPCRTNGPTWTLGQRVRFYGTGKLSHKLSGSGVIVQLPSHGDHCVLIRMESGNTLPINSDRLTSD